MKALKKQVHQTKKEAIKASSQWEKKHTINIEKYKKKTAKMKIQVRAEKIKLAEMNTEHQTLQSAYQYLRQDFERQISDFVALREEYHCHATQREELIGHL